MQSTTRTTATLLAATAIAAVAGGAWARNDRLLLPIEPALRSNESRTVLAADMPLRFGKVSAQGAQTVGGASVQAVADPFGPIDNNNGGRRLRRPDEIVCQEAFRRALAMLQARGRAVDASAVVGIVSNTGNLEMDSPSTYECRIGHSRGVVDLKGAFVLSATAAAAAWPAEAAAPVAPVAPVAASVPPVLATPLVPVAAPPVQPRHIASGFAAIDDIDAIPFLNDRGRSEYRQWLTWSTPRAFALSNKGAFYATSGLEPKDASLPSDPSQRALLMCERAAKAPCKLYAVNGAVVWTRE